MSIAAAVVLCLMLAFIFGLGIALSVVAYDTFTDGLAIFKMVKPEQIKSVGIPLGIFAMFIYFFATYKYVSYCLKRKEFEP